MPDRYQSLIATPVGKFAVKSLGLPNPRPLRRFVVGEPLLSAPVLIGGEGDLSEAIRAAALAAGAVVAASAATTSMSGTARFGALVFDATAIGSSEELVGLHDFFSPVGRDLVPCGRVIIFGRTPSAAKTPSGRVAQRALEGFARSLGKEIGRGSTVNLVYVTPGAEDRIESSLTFLLSGRSAYVSGQVIRIGTDVDATVASGKVAADTPLRGKVALVTGAARGIGAAIARTLCRDGATVVGLDVPQAASDLQDLMDQLDGHRLSLDITAADAPDRIARSLVTDHGGVDIVVHNAGITRDKKLVNMPRDWWTSVIDVNLRAPELITAQLLGDGVIRANGRVVAVASIAGIAGNAGQTNYATSKAGVIGFVDAFGSVAAERGVTVNAVAPGFIETQMTAAVPFMLREAGRRMNSMAQGGLPVDVAETIGWFADPGSFGVTGNVVRVCGQSLLGA